MASDRVDTHKNSSTSKPGCFTCFTSPKAQERLPGTEFATKNAKKAPHPEPDTTDGWSIPTTAAEFSQDNTETPGVPASTLQRGSSNRDVLAEEAGDVSAKPELPKQPKVPSKRRSPSPARHVNDNAVITARLRSLEDIQLVEHDSTASSLAPRQQDQVPQQGPERIPSSPVPPLNLGFTGRSPSSDPRSSGSVGANHALHTASNVSRSNTPGLNQGPRTASNVSRSASPDPRGSKAAGLISASRTASSISNADHGSSLGARSRSRSISPVRHSSLGPKQGSRIARSRSRSPIRAVSNAASVISMLSRSRSISPIHAEINAGTRARSLDPVKVTSTAESRARSVSPVRGTLKHPSVPSGSAPAPPEKLPTLVARQTMGRHSPSNMLQQLAAEDSSLPAEQSLLSASELSHPQSQPLGHPVQKQPSVGNLLATLQHLNLNQRLREPLEHVSTAVQAAKSWQDKVAALQKDPDTREKKLGSREDVRWEVWRLRAANEQLQKHSSELASKLAAQNSGSPAHEKENKLKPQASLSPQRLSLSPQRASLGPQHSAPSPAKSVGSSSGPASNWLKATQVGKPRPATADSPAAASPESAAYYTRENEQLKAWISELQSANTRLEQERAQAQLKIEDLSRELLRAKQDMSELRITQAPRSDSLPRENSFAWLQRTSQAVQPLPAAARTWAKPHSFSSTGSSTPTGTSRIGSKINSTMRTSSAPSVAGKPEAAAGAQLQPRQRGSQLGSSAKVHQGDNTVTYHVSNANLSQHKAPAVKPYATRGPAPFR